MSWKKLALLATVFAGILWYRQYVLSTENPVPALPAGTTTQPDQDSSQSTKAESVAAQHTFSATRDGQTAEELLSASAEVTYENFGEAGKFVTSINGLAADEGHYWAFYVNGEYSQTGVSQTILSEGDIITFTYETIDPTQL